MKRQTRLTRCDVVVIGGGPAGCCTAAILAKKGFAVQIFESRRLPRHKLCGEFLSYDSLSILDSLGVENLLHGSGAAVIDSALVTAPSGASFRSSLPKPCLGISRYLLDHILWQRALDLGAQGATKTQVSVVRGNLREGFEISTIDGRTSCRLVIGAFGKRSSLDRFLRRRFFRRAAPLVGWKSHLNNVTMPSQVELHSFRGGYCGFSPVENGRVNCCGLARYETLRRCGGRIESLMHQACQENSSLSARYRAGERAHDWLVMGQIPLAAKEPFVRDICMVGDAAGMIAPLCGDGMAMAMQSAIQASELAGMFLKNDLQGPQFKSEWRCKWRAEFVFRRRLGRILQGTFLVPAVAGVVIRALSAEPRLYRWLVRKTRG